MPPSNSKVTGDRLDPVDHCTRHGAHAPYRFGFEMVVVIASWDRLRVPGASGLIDPQRRGPQNILVRQMLKALHTLGAVTIVLSQKRRHDGPKKVKSIVTHLTEAHAGMLLRLYAWRWGVEITIKALKSGLHLGQRPVIKEAERVTRSVALSVVAYLLLVRLYGHDQARHKEWSLFKRKEHLTEDMAQEHMRHYELRWQRTLQRARSQGPANPSRGHFPLDCSRCLA